MSKKNKKQLFKLNEYKVDVYCYKIMNDLGEFIRLEDDDRYVIAILPGKESQWWTEEDADKALIEAAKQNQRSRLRVVKIKY